MKAISAKAIFSLVAVAAISVACHGNAPFTPALSPSASSQAASDQSYVSTSDLPESVRQPLEDAGVTKLPKCPAKPVGVPGTMWVLVGLGNVSGTTFTAVSSASLWAEYTLAKATKPPSPSPTGSPTSLPTSQPVYFYYGTFTLKTGGNGCAYFVTTKSGQSLTQSYNGEDIGYQLVKAKYYKSTVMNYGHLTMKIKKLSASGGKGVFVLKTTSGATVNKGTIKLVGRIYIK